MTIPKRNRILAIGLQEALAAAAELNANRPSRKLKTVTDGVYQGSIESLKGAKLRLMARSRSTGGLTCQFLQDQGAYQTGALINIAPYELGNMVTHQVED